MNNLDLPVWWDKEKWREKIIKDPRQKAILLTKIFELAMFHILDEWEKTKTIIEEKSKSKNIVSIKSLINKEMGRLK